MRKERGKKRWGGVRRERKKTKRGGEVEWSAREENRRRGREKRKGMGRSRGVASGGYGGLTDTRFDLTGTTDRYLDCKGG